MWVYHTRGDLGHQTLKWVGRAVLGDPRAHQYSADPVVQEFRWGPVDLADPVDLVAQRYSEACLCFEGLVDPEVQECPGGLEAPGNLEDLVVDRWPRNPFALPYPLG